MTLLKLQVDTISSGYIEKILSKLYIEHYEQIIYKRLW